MRSDSAGRGTSARGASTIGAVINTGSDSARKDGPYSTNLTFQCDFSHELHEDPSFALITVHEEVDDLVVDVLLLEHDEVLLAATRSFHSIFENFFGHNQPGILVS